MAIICDKNAPLYSSEHRDRNSRGGDRDRDESRAGRPSRFGPPTASNNADGSGDGGGGAAPELSEEQKMLAMMGLPMGFGVDDDEKKEKPPNWVASAPADEEGGGDGGDGDGAPARPPGVQPAPPGC